VSNLIAIFIVLGFVSAPVFASELKMVAAELVNKLPKGTKIALQPINQKKAKIPAGVAKSLYEKVTNHIASLALDKSITVMDRGNLKLVQEQQEEFFGVDAFEKLFKQAGAETIVSIQISRENPKQVSLSLRATGVIGEKAGQILAATSNISISVPERYSVSIEGVFSKNKERKKYNNSLESGVTKYKEVSLTSSKSVYDIDFIVRADYSYTKSREKTAASRETEQSAKIIGSMGSIMSGMMGTKGGGNPMGSMMAGIGSSTDSKAQEKIVLTLNVDSQLKNKINDEIKKDTKELTITFPGDATNSMLKSKLQSSLRKLIEKSGQTLIAKALGKPLPEEDNPNKLD